MTTFTVPADALRDLLTCGLVSVCTDATLPAIIRAFVSIAAAARGELTAEVTSAHPLSTAQLTQLAGKLKAREGKDVKIAAKVDPEILGGLVVRIGSTQIDSSIRTRLNSLAQAMKG